MSRSFARARLAVVVLLVATAGVAAYFHFLSANPADCRTLPPDAALAAFVRARPPVPVAFTSRTSAGSLQPHADEGEGFRFPGAPSWTATEGRLRLLDPDGSVFELTWNRPLPDGGTLIDVMTPTVTLDGTAILFAGRKAQPDAGRWRIFRVNLDGTGLEQLTGRADDLGCVAVPPMRFAADGGKLPDADRKRLDYDDVDPIDLGPGGFAFASNRLPDLGRDHARRATQIWRWPSGATEPHPLTANRNNDRWPYLLPGGTIAYSLWSRTREAVTADLMDFRPIATGGVFATTTTERWVGGKVSANGAQVGYSVKSTEPVWRPRPLFNKRMAFMTDTGGDGTRLRLAQAVWGYIASAPSSLAVGETLSPTTETRLHFGPTADADGRELSAGCPSPCPPGRVVFAAKPTSAPAPAFALYTVSDNWSSVAPVPEVLFDDPAFVDAEPVAVYARPLANATDFPDSPPATYNPPAALQLVDGTNYTGPSGYVENLAILAAIRAPIPWQSAEVAPGVRRDPRVRPLVPPPLDLKAVAVYADHRDRFDDPVVPRIVGRWEKQLVLPVAQQANGELTGWLPSNPLAPAKLVGLDATGRVAKWTGTEIGPNGRPATFLGVAGDHHSDFRPHGYHYCNGCHAGHTFTSLDIRERVK